MSRFSKLKIQNAIEQIEAMSLNNEEKSIVAAILLGESNLKEAFNNHSNIDIDKADILADELNNHTISWLEERYDYDEDKPLVLTA